MKGLVKILLFSLVAVRASAAMEELKLQCSDPNTSTKLIISMVQPDMVDDCDINDDCNQTSGWFVLTGNLAEPQKVEADADKLDRETDSFTEKETDQGLIIEQDERFTIRFRNDFRYEIENLGNTNVMITSLVTEGDSNGDVQLNCTK